MGGQELSLPAEGTRASPSVLVGALQEPSCSTRRATEPSRPGWWFKTP